MHFQSGKEKKGEKGQVSVLFALVFTFLFVLFAFVIDFGHLVNNKINLQLAADAAAYAGAAWQARVLNRMGMVNYKLRQNLKEFTMKTQVTHLRHNRNYPRGFQFINGGDQAHRSEPFICQQAHGYRAISGLQYAQDTNLCKNASPSVGGLPPIVVPPVIARFDPFAVAIAAQIRRIQQAANQECRAAAVDNRVLAQYMIDAYTRRSQFVGQQMEFLRDFINDIGDETDAASSEHPAVQAAYQSALRNLSLSNNDPDSFELEVLLPRGDEFIQLERQTMRATLFYINFQVEGNGCVGRPAFIDFDSMVGGFSKTPSKVTFFAVKASSQPRLMFMPSRWVEAAFPTLEAFASAKPFGSRIGPDLSGDSLAPIANRPRNNNRQMNFSVRPNDSLGMFNTKLMAYYDGLHPFSGIGRPEGNRERGWPTPRNNSPGAEAMRAIRAPTIFDAAFYTIYPDVGPNVNTDYLEADFARSLYPDYMESTDFNGTDINLPEPNTPAYFEGSNVARSGFMRLGAPETGVGGPYRGYLDEQRVAHSVTSAVGLPLINGPDKANEFGFASPDQIHSGWAPPERPGRIGYSVKFIGMDALTRTLRVRLNQAGTEGPIENPPEGDENINNVRH